MSSINLTDSFLTFNIPYPLPLAVKRPKNSSHTTQNCFTHLSHTPHSLLVGPTSILPWYIQPINISFWMESTIHCQHLSSHFIQCFQFFLCPSYLLHTWSALTAAQVLIAITLFFQFNLDFSLLFYFLFHLLFVFYIRLNNPQIFIPSSPLFPIVRRCKRVIPSILTFFSLVTTNTVVTEGWN